MQCGMYQLRTMMDEVEDQNHDIQKTIRAMLAEYKDIFEEPKALPPSKEVDHQIPLQPNAKPVSIRPYKYPHFHKNEIERLVQEMMGAGIIHDSRSPFSSPVLLVKKKDGSWTFCVDYQTLNNTMKRLWMSCMGPLVSPSLI